MRQLFCRDRQLRRKKVLHNCQLLWRITKLRNLFGKTWKRLMPKRRCNIWSKTFALMTFVPLTLLFQGISSNGTHSRIICCNIICYNNILKWHLVWWHLYEHHFCNDICSNAICYNDLSYVYTCSHEMVSIPLFVNSTLL